MAQPPAPPRVASPPTVTERREARLLDHARATLEDATHALNDGTIQRFSARERVRNAAAALTWVLNVTTATPSNVAPSVRACLFDALDDATDVLTDAVDNLDYPTGR